MIFIKKIALLIYIIIACSIQANEILASVGGESITVKDANQYLQIAAPGVKYSSLKPQEKTMVLSQIIDRKILLIIAKKNKINRDANFKYELNFLKNNYTIDYLMRNKANKIKIKPQEIKKYFNNNKDKFEQKEEFLVSHILVTTEKEAQSLIRKLMKVSSSNLNQKFKELAQNKSIGPSKNNGGSIGWAKDTDMLPSFFSRVEHMKKGTVSKKYAKTSFGYHVIYLQDKKDKQKIKFKDIKDKLSKALVMERLKKDMSLEIEQVKKLTKIEFK